MCITDVRIVAGDALRLGPAASPQFTDATTINVRVISVIRDDTRTSQEGWVWLDVYVLNRLGNATHRRTVYIRAAGARRPDPPRRRGGT